ncbi:MAG TPA: enolase C-terminal domain-like protein [Roseiflexaceae bacterium]|nr:enolase C-terminal domain-like protein [Roseiflexaceae bacterium]HMP40606.1 enolase C-terminal domain-like protein [Roseiflexaceae bacterium]
MHIRTMHVTPVAMSDPPLLNAAGLHAPYALRVIVELVTDDGISGVGEVPGGAAVVADLEALRPLVEGRDPFALNALDMALAHHYAQWDGRRRARAYAALEVACLDICGKACGRPVADLLGGIVRERVDFSAYLFFKYAGAGGELGFATDPAAAGWAAARQQAALDPAGIVAQAQAMCHAFGFRSIKLKAGILEPAIEVGAILALREAFGPNIPLRIDPNAVWSVETAITWGKRLEGVLEYYEDPTRSQEAMAAVARAVAIPLATNMCTTSFDDLPGSVRHGSEQIILSDHHFWGGLRASVELARFCRTFGRGLSMHSNSHLGISLAAMTHLAAAVPNLTFACDTHYPWQSEDVIAGGRWQFDEGAIVVPPAPGLGVELDREALARLHANYLACGLTERNDEIEMQKVQPGWKFVPVRY